MRCGEVTTWKEKSSKIR